MTKFKDKFMCVFSLDRSKQQGSYLLYRKVQIEKKEI